MMRVRTFPESNYRGIYVNGKTLRIALDPSKPITELKYPEFYDIKLTNRCYGSCPYCYQDSRWSDKNYDALKLHKFLSHMKQNQRPFQIAYGGGEPTLHPEFPKIMKMTRELGIAPNYTTNGMFIHDAVFHSAVSIIDVTKRYCEGVAITCHPHLQRYWTACADEFIKQGIFTNFHILIDDCDSVSEFTRIYADWRGSINYFVLLPMMNQGRMSEATQEGYDLLFHYLEEWKKMDDVDISDIAFGANFYPYLKGKPWLDVDLYEPEIMSKYLDLGTMTLYPSSFATDKPIGVVNV